MRREPVFDWRGGLRKNRSQDPCFLRGNLSCLKAIPCPMGCCRPPLFNFSCGELSLVCFLFCEKGLCFPWNPTLFPRRGKTEPSPWRSVRVESCYAAEMPQLPCGRVPHLLQAFHSDYLQGSSQFQSAFSS